MGKTLVLRFGWTWVGADPFATWVERLSLRSFVNCRNPRVLVVRRRILTEGTNQTMVSRLFSQILSECANGCTVFSYNRCSALLNERAMRSPSPGHFALPLGTQPPSLLFFTMPCCCCCHSCCWRYACVGL